MKTNELILAGLSIIAMACVWGNSQIDRRAADPVRPTVPKPHHEVRLYLV